MKALPILLLLATLAAGPALQAQTSAEPENADAPAADQPVLRIDFEETDAIPGQFLTLRLTVLVPTFMPSPPVWPSFEAPNLLVRIPEGGTSPVSERIDGETWSGISRRYRVAPMIPGTFDLPSQEVIVTWAGEGGAADPIQSSLSTGALSFTGVIPEGAEGLDPFIAASDLTLTQEIEGEPGAMVPGDSVKRIVTAELENLSPMFLPNLLAPGDIPGVAAYPDEPVLNETDNRGTLGGTRRESITYVAEGGGGGTLPTIKLQWFDIDTGTIETASVETVEIAVDGPPVTLANPEDRKRLIWLAAAGLAAALLVGLILWKALPPLRRRARDRHAAHLASESHAWHELSKTVSRQDYAVLYTALDTWSDRVETTDPRRDPDVQAALAALGAAHFGSQRPATAPKSTWRTLDTALRAARKPLATHDRTSALPPLNPGASA